MIRIVENLLEMSDSDMASMPPLTFQGYFVHMYMPELYMRLSKARPGEDALPPQCRHYGWQAAAPGAHSRTIWLPQSATRLQHNLGFAFIEDILTIRACYGHLKKQTSPDTALMVACELLAPYLKPMGSDHQ